MHSRTSRSTRQRSFFAIVHDANTWRRLLFLLLAAPLGLLHGGLLLAGAIALTAIASAALALPLPASLVVLTLIVPAVGAGTVVVHYLLRVQARVNQRLLGVPAPRSALDDLADERAFAWCAARLGDRRTWLGFLYLLFVTALGLVATAAVALVVGVSVSLVSEAMNGRESAVDVAVGADPLDLPGARVLMALVAPLLAIVGLHIASILAGLAARVGDLLLGACPRAQTCRSAAPLSAPAPSAYPRHGSIVGGHGD
jgi:hypothetical protein